MGRRTKYSEEIVGRIVDAIELGATYEMAAAYGGITFETLRQWRKRYPSFSDALKQAEGRAVLKWLYRIEQAANAGTWQAAAWKLERRYPSDYGRTVTDVNANLSGEVTTVLVRRGDD